MRYVQPDFKNATTAELDKMIEAGFQEAFRICKGGKWTMCVPVDSDDSDNLICDGLSAGKEALRRLEVSG